MIQDSQGIFTSLVCTGLNNWRCTLETGRIDIIHGNPYMRMYLRIGASTNDQHWLSGHVAGPNSVVKFLMGVNDQIPSGLNFLHRGDAENK